MRAIPNTTYYLMIDSDGKVVSSTLPSRVAVELKRDSGTEHRLMWYEITFDRIYRFLVGTAYSYDVTHGMHEYAYVFLAAAPDSNNPKKWLIWPLNLSPGYQVMQVPFSLIIRP